MLDRVVIGAPSGGEKKGETLVGDATEIPDLREALYDREPWVRKAGKEAIELLEQKASGTRPTNEAK
jgi:hypothetical protein